MFNDQYSDPPLAYPPDPGSYVAVTGNLWTELAPAETVPTRLLIPGGTDSIVPL